MVDSEVLTIEYMSSQFVYTSKFKLNKDDH